MTSRVRGAGLAEAVLALVLAALITSAAVVTLGRAIRTTASVALHGERLDAGRTAVAVLRSDLSWLTPSDFHAGSDSIRLRVFRGLAIPCDTIDGALVVRYRGAREPAPEKDSVLLLDPNGEASVGLSGWSVGASSTCPIGSGGELMRWTLASPPVVVPVALLFETGTYVIPDGVLRYRRGAGGRQPLTAPAFGAASGFAVAGAAIRVDLPGAGSFAGSSGSASMRIELRNARAGTN